MPHEPVACQLQADIDTWQNDIKALSDDASAAVAAASSRPAASTPGGALLVSAAKTNIKFVTGDGSNGVHNYPYAKAGLEKAKYLAQSVGAGFTTFATTSFDAQGRARDGLRQAHVR